MIYSCVCIMIIVYSYQTGRWIYEALTKMKNYSMGIMDERQKIFLYGSVSKFQIITLPFRIEGSLVRGIQRSLDLN